MAALAGAPPQKHALPDLHNACTTDEECNRSDSDCGSDDPLMTAEKSTHKIEPMSVKTPMPSALPKTVLDRSISATTPMDGSGMDSKAANGVDDFPPETTIMLRNIPSRCPPMEALAVIEKIGFADTYNMFYLPMKRNACQNYGYAFIGFKDPSTATKFLEVAEGYKLKETSDKALKLARVHILGSKSTKAHFVCEDGVKGNLSPLFLKETIRGPPSQFATRATFQRDVAAKVPSADIPAKSSPAWSPYRDEVGPTAAALTLRSLLKGVVSAPPGFEDGPSMAVNKQVPKMKTSGVHGPKNGASATVFTSPVLASVPVKVPVLNQRDREAAYDGATAATISVSVNFQYF